MTSNRKVNTVKSKQRRILKTNHYLKRLLRKLRKRLVRRWQEMPFIRSNQLKGNANLKKKLHTSSKKTNDRMNSTIEKKPPRVKNFGGCSHRINPNIDQDRITQKSITALKRIVSKPLGIIRYAKTARLPILAKYCCFVGFFQKTKEEFPIKIINLRENRYKHEAISIAISIPNTDSTEFTLQNSTPPPEKNKENPSTNDLLEKSLKPIEGKEKTDYPPANTTPFDGIPETAIDHLLSTIDRLTGYLFQLKNNIREIKRKLRRAKNDNQDVAPYINQIENLKLKFEEYDKTRGLALEDILNTDPNIQNSQGRTLTHCLAAHGDFGLLQDLVMNKILNPFIKDNLEKTPKDIAKDSKYFPESEHIKNTREFFDTLNKEQWSSLSTYRESPIQLEYDPRNIFNIRD
ncbi:MAG: hypothetical protein AB2992_02865 [Candidatus Symbiodolus clandestinus]